VENTNLVAPCVHSLGQLDCRELESDCFTMFQSKSPDYCESKKEKV